MFKICSYSPVKLCQEFAHANRYTITTWSCWSYYKLRQIEIRTSWPLQSHCTATAMRYLKKCRYEEVNFFFKVNRSFTDSRFRCFLCDRYMRYPMTMTLQFFLVLRFKNASVEISVLSVFQRDLRLKNRTWRLAVRRLLLVARIGSLIIVEEL